ncbi:TetR/AcrR family transcriptional regulator [[Mycobacterium] nativiensis]|uniref:TetR/AcrR family transcriptional regulator n=1 Tax=[Mycobacterium] nativiensis TaxID=2855503 RepID=A0ABU5XVV0_9MYCO|nr:TetR/AcrR family transcriptional regulator [Mycolicibacter sp. MYC340]MEB3031872.1 TetR/AcrR family transcriptional regulator [Mycolicibacter sp. MYC340]
MSIDAGSMTRAERKRAEQAAQLRAEIVDAAFAEFAAVGYHATTIADIARRLSVSPGTVYNYFKNKRDIVDHVVSRLEAQLRAALVGDNAPGTARTLAEFRAQTMRIATAVDALFYADERMARVLLFEVTAIDATMTERVLAMFDAAHQISFESLTDGARRGFLRDDVDIGATADVIVGVMISASVRNLRNSYPAADRQAWREAAVGVLIEGIAARG